MGWRPWEWRARNQSGGVGSLSGLVCKGHPNSGIDPASLTSPALAGRFFAIRTTWEAKRYAKILKNIQNK